MFALAWRNIWRKRGRSLMTAGAIALVVLITFLFFGLGTAIDNGLYQRLTERAGHLQVRVAGYRDVREFADGLIYDAAAVQSKLQATLPEAEWVAALDVPGLLEGDGRSRGIVLSGMAHSPALRTQFSDTHLVAGALPEPDDLQGIALGSRLARALRVELGDTVYLFAPGTLGFGAAAYTVVGLLDYGEASLDARSAFVSLAAAQELAAPDAVSRFGLQFPHITRVIDDARILIYQEALSAALGDTYTVETWRQVEPAMAATIELTEPMMAVFAAIFFILAGLLVTNTIYLSLIERIREFGVIMALGANRRQVIGMVLTESLLLCLAGAAVGAAFGGISLAFMAQGFSFPEPLASAYAEIGLPRVFYAGISLSQVLTVLAFTLATAILAALIPARAAGKLEPVEAMRFTA